MEISTPDNNSCIRIKYLILYEDFTLYCLIFPQFIEILGNEYKLSGSRTKNIPGFGKCRSPRVPEFREPKVGITT